MTRRIGDLASAAGVSVETVRFYEREGLIDRPNKPTRGWRTYSDAAQGQIGLIRLGRAIGLRLTDIRRLRGRAREPQKVFCTEVRRTVTASLAVVEAEIATLQARRAALQSWLGQCEGREQAASCPLYDQVRSLLQTAPGVGT